MTADRVPLLDLQVQRGQIGDAIEKALSRVLEHGRFVNGPEVEQLEDELAEFTGSRHVVACSSGTDAIVLALMALDIGPGDAVAVPSFTFAATAGAVVLAGATPIFADSLATAFDIDAAGLAAAHTLASKAGLHLRAVIAVDLFGQPADYDAVRAAAAALGLAVIGDAAQSVGAYQNGVAVGCLADITTASFYPSKPLGCYGDGGAMFTADEAVAARLRSLREHGMGSHRYEHVRVGMNGRLDTFQAAVLLEKLKIFPREIAERDRLARRYSDALVGVVEVPAVRSGSSSVWAQYTIVCDDRDGLAASLAAAGVQSAVHYPMPLHEQVAFRAYPAIGPLPNAERHARRVLSVPMHAYLDERSQDRVIEAVLAGSR